MVILNPSFLIDFIQKDRDTISLLRELERDNEIICITINYYTGTFQGSILIIRY